MHWWWRWTKYPRSYDGGSYRVESRWREEVVYWEGSRGVVFDAGWGVKPPILYVPTQSVWDEAVPPWLRGRSTEVIARLREHSGHVVEETEAGYRSGPIPELAPVATVAEAQVIAERFLRRAAVIAEYVIVDAEPVEHDRGWLFHCQPTEATTAESLDFEPQPLKLLVRRDTGEPIVE
jgi:hypothetical protein